MESDITTWWHIADFCSRLCQTNQGVSQLVTFGGRAAKADDTLIDMLRQWERILPKQNMFYTVDSVLNTEGPIRWPRGDLPDHGCEATSPHPDRNPRQTRAHGNRCWLLAKGEN